MPTRKTETWMWQRAWDLLDRAERLNRHFFLQPSAAARPVWEPPIDVFETEAQVWIVIALPGVDGEKIELSLQGPHLVVAGERTRPEVCRHMIVRRMEIPHGRFERRVALPAGRYQVDSREMVDGCLVVSLSKL